MGASEDWVLADAVGAVLVLDVVEALGFDEPAVSEESDGDESFEEALPPEELPLCPGFCSAMANLTFLKQAQRTTLSITVRFLS